MKNKPFWETKTLEQMTHEEWESVCDACKLLDPVTCRCRHYENRQAFVPECVQIRPQDIKDIYWLPKTCAYRLLNEGKPLPKWHPLITGDPTSVHAAKMSASGRTVPPKPEEEFQDYIVEWDDL